MTPVHWSQVDAVWHEIEDGVRAACERDPRHGTPKDWHARLLSRDAQLWRTLSGGAIITEVYFDGVSDVCGMTIYIGNVRHDMEDAITTLKSWARDVGCSRISQTGSPAWARLLKRHGFRTTAATIEGKI